MGGDPVTRAKGRLDGGGPNTTFSEQHERAWGHLGPCSVISRRLAWDPYHTFWCCVLSTDEEGISQSQEEQQGTSCANLREWWHQASFATSTTPFSFADFGARVQVHSKGQPSLL